jgi:GDP-L-fucose synthase
MKTMLVCGATGFIGKNVVQYFKDKKKYNIRAVYHNKPPSHNMKVEWVQANLNNVEDVNRVMKGVDIVVQMAATTSGARDIINRPHIHVTDNAVMNSLLLRSAFDNNVEHFIFPSCTVMYQPNNTAIQETDFDQNKDLLSKYFGVGNTKVYIEKMCKFYSRLGKTKHTVIRQSNIYGPHDKYDLEKSHVFGATITKVMSSTNGIVSVWGSGEEKRDLLHVNDLVRFIEKAIENQKIPFGLYNVGLNSAISINDLVTKIIKKSGKKLKVSRDLSQPTIKTNVCLDCTRAKTDLGWQPVISLDEGIENTLNWYKENIQ